MPELIAKSALDGQPPLTLGGVTLAEAASRQITSVALLPGGGKAVAKALKGVGLAFPDPNGSVTNGTARILWTGRDQAFLIGMEPPPLDGAAVTDQTGGWATLTLSGPAAVDALMRLVPLDLRLAAFPVGRSVRVPLNHIGMVLLRTGEDAFELMVFRSMAQTAWHELTAVMQALHARAGLKP